MKRFGLGKVLLLSALIIGTSGCFGNSNAEIAKVKKEKLPFEKVSYTYQQLADTLQDPKWTQKTLKADENGIKPVNVTLSGDGKVMGEGGEFLFKLSIKEAKGLNSDGSYYNINGKVMKRIDLKLNVKLKNEVNSLTISYGSGYGTTCTGELIKPHNKDKLSNHECIKFLNSVLNGIIKGELK